MNPAPFQLDPAFEISSHPLLNLALCEVRLQDDVRFPWLILAPRVGGAVEIEDLAPADRTRLLDEIVLAGAAVRALGLAQGLPVEKLNVGALGNVTRQLHVHVVGRRGDDPAWPGPVWGVGGTERYGTSRLAVLRETAVEVLRGGEG